MVQYGGYLLKGSLLIVKVLKHIAKHFCTACVYFTLVQLFITVVFQLLSQQTANATFMPMETELILLAFSVAMAYIQDVLKIKSISLTARVLLHALCYTASVFLLFVAVTKQISNIPALLFILVGALGVYAIVGGAALAVYLVNNRTKPKGEEYVSQFKG